MDRKRIMRNTTGTVILVILLLILIGGGVFLYQKRDGTRMDESIGEPISVVTYVCDRGHSIRAAYYERLAEVAIDNRATSTLNQTVSASGIRYGNADESFVFWSKGDEALIMRNNSMDQEYANCSSTAQSNEQPE